MLLKIRGIFGSVSIAADQDNGIIKVYGILERNAAYKRIKGEKK